MGYRLGTFTLNGVEFRGRPLDGRNRGEQISVPLEGDQGATDTYLILEEDIPGFLEAVLGDDGSPQWDEEGKAAISAARHYVLDRLVIVDVQLRPYVPNTPETVGHPTLGESYAAGVYALWEAVVKYAEDRGWVDNWKGSLKTAAVDAAVPASGTNKAYTQKAIIPFPEANLTITRRRVPRQAFNPQDILTAFAGKVNVADWTLPWSGQVVPAECAQFLTFTATPNAVTYGPRYWTVVYEFLVQDISWNKARHRDDGEPVDLTRPDGSPLFGTVDFDDLLV